MPAERVSCPADGCDNNGGAGFANAGALRFHAIAKHRADAGWCDECGAEFDRLTTHRKRTHGDDRAIGMYQIDPGGSSASAPGEAPAGANPEDGEAPPTIPDGMRTDPGPATKPKLTERIRAKVWDRPGVGPSTPVPGGATTPGERPPKAKPSRRASTAPIGTLVWGGAGAMLERTGADIPVGRTLQFQSEMAGDVLDRLIAGTWLDRALQPFASKTDDLEAIAALFALPVLVATIERSPAAGITLEPLLREAIRSNISGMAPVVKKRKAEAKKFAEAAAELGITEAAPGTDPVQVILAAIFAPPPEAAPAPGASPNGAEHDPSGAGVGI